MNARKPADSAAQLTAELEAAALRAIRRQYSDLNATFFGGRLVRPFFFELTDGATRLGSWVYGRRRLEISRRLLLDHGWATVVEVLKHEMAHQFVDEVLGCVDERAHGPTFRRICAERGVDANATGIPKASAAPSAVLDRVTKLLALAGSSNEHEAQAAMAAARRLMLKHNLDEVGQRANDGYSFRHLGEPTGRVSEADRLLANILGEHFFVDVIWVPVWRAREGKRGTVLEVTGTLPNLEMADYVHAFLTHTADRLWKEHKRRFGIRRNADRRAYLAGVMSGFLEKLSQQAKTDASEGLVWIGDPGLETFFKQRHPRIRWTRHVSSRATNAHQQGREAGRNIVLHRGIQKGPSGPPRLLSE